MHTMILFVSCYNCSDIEKFIFLHDFWLEMEFIFQYLLLFCMKSRVKTYYQTNSIKKNRHIEFLCVCFSLKHNY